MEAQEPGMASASPDPVSVSGPVAEPEAESAVGTPDPAGSQTIDQAIKEGNFLLAGRKLESYRLEYGETPHYLYFLAMVKLGLQLLPEANELLKALYYLYPVFMADRPDYVQFQRERINPPLEAAKTLWNQTLHLFSHKVEGLPTTSGPEVPKKEISFQDQDEIKKELKRIAALFQQVLEIEPMHADAMRGLIQCASELGNLEEVMALKTRLEEVPAYWDGLRLKRAESAYAEAKKAYKEENYDLANRILNLGLEGVPDDAHLLLLKAEILLKRGKFREAMGCVDIVMSRFPGHTEGMRTKGKIQAARFDHDFTTAQELLSEADDKPTGSTAQQALAKEALSHFLEALAYDPANMLALGGVHRCHTLCNNPLKAHAAMNRIKELDPHYKIPGPKKKKTVLDEEFMPEPCFVATRVFGAESRECQILRAFRDDWLVWRGWGRVLVAWYRRVGPALARMPGQGPLLPAVRLLLRGLTRLLANTR